MTMGQVVFAVIASVVGVAGLTWTVTWTLRSWRKAGPEVIAELGRGDVDDRGILQIFLQSRPGKIMRVSGDPWGLREKLATKEQKDSERSGGTQSAAGADPQLTDARGRTPLDYAHSNGHSLATELLKAWTSR
jgi:hypothetical protein